MVANYDVSHSKIASTTLHFLIRAHIGFVVSGGGSYIAGDVSIKARSGGKSELLSPLTRRSFMHAVVVGTVVVMVGLGKR